MHAAPQPPPGPAQWRRACGLHLPVPGASLGSAPGRGLALQHRSHGSRQQVCGKEPTGPILHTRPRRTSQYGMKGRPERHRRGAAWRGGRQGGALSDRDGCCCLCVGRAHAARTPGVGEDDLPRHVTRTESGGPCSQSAQLLVLCVHQPGPQRVNVSSNGDEKGPTAPYMTPPA